MEALINYAQPGFKGSIVKEYALVIRPGAAVYEQVMGEKENFFNVYQEETALQIQPRIMVAGFLAKEEMEETLLRWLHKIISSKNVFTLALNNYGGFPGNGAVYLRVQDHQPFKQLARELKVIDELVKSNGLPKASLITHPHLPIAERMDTALYEKAMRDYSGKEFHASFEVNEMVLLKSSYALPCTKQVSVFRLKP